MTGYEITIFPRRHTPPSYCTSPEIISLLLVEGDKQKGGLVSSSSSSSSSGSVFIIELQSFLISTACSVRLAFSSGQHPTSEPSTPGLTRFQPIRSTLAFLAHRQESYHIIITYWRSETNGRSCIVIVVVVSLVVVIVVVVPLLFIYHKPGGFLCIIPSPPPSVVFTSLLCFSRQ